MSPGAEGADGSALLEGLALGRAAALARAGRYEEALALLEADATDGPEAAGAVDDVDGSAAVLDLKARIAAQQRRYEEAEALWGRAAEMDPGRPEYAAGARRAAAYRRRPWFGLMASAVRIALVPSVLVLALAGILWARGPTAPTTELPKGGPPPKETVSPKVMASDLEVPGTKVHAEGAELVIVFEEGVFAEGSVFAPGAARTLRELARRIAGQPGVICVRVIGHTDDLPISADAVYWRDNFELGAVRAASVAGLMCRASGLPERLIQVSSAGASAPPFENDERGRLRNRTVVVRVSYGQPEAGDAAGTWSGEPESEGGGPDAG